MTNKILRTHLTRLRACQEAVDWLGERDLATCWTECPRGDWLLWLGWSTRVDRKLLVKAACRCAALALPIFEARYPDDKRPRESIEITLRWTSGSATIKEVRAAAYAAAAAANAAYAANAANAAYAAANAANAANAATVAADAAAAAAYAAANAADAAAAAAYASEFRVKNAADAVDAVAARAKMRCRTADVVRQIITVEMIETALMESGK